MPLRNDKNGYGSVTKSLHWTIFILFTIMFVLGFGLMGGEEGSSVFGAEWSSVFDWHATLGLIVLGLALVRIVWRAKTPLPSWAPGLSTRERSLAHRTEQVMYFVMVAKPLSGYVLAGSAGQSIHLFGTIGLGNPFGESSTLENIALAVHIVTGVMFLLVWFVHVGQALRHQFVLKDGLLRRMLPAGGGPVSSE